jgi:transposase
MTDATRSAGGVRFANQARLFVAKRMRRRSRVSKDDVLFGYRLRLFALAGEIGVRPACRAMGVHHSTYYRWAARVERWGLEALRPRERRRPRMPNRLGPHLEQKVVAFALGQPGFGPKRISAELAREKWGGLRISPNGVWRVLQRQGLQPRDRAGHGERRGRVERALQAGGHRFDHDTLH